MQNVLSSLAKRHLVIWNCRDLKACTPIRNALNYGEVVDYDSIPTAIIHYYPCGRFPSTISERQMHIRHEHNQTNLHIYCLLRTVFCFPNMQNVLSSLSKRDF